MPWAVLAAVAGWTAAGILPSAPARDGFHLAAVGRIPVLANGRVQPLESVGRNALLQIRSTASVPGGGGGTVDATRWLLEVLTRPHLADRRRIFLVHHPELLGELDLEPQAGSGLSYYSWQELAPRLEEIQRQARRIDSIEPGRRSAAERQLAKLHNALGLYHRLRNSLQPNSLLQGRHATREGSFAFPRRLARFRAGLPAAAAALAARQRGEEFDQEAAGAALGFLEPFQAVAQSAPVLLIPPAHPATGSDVWESVGDSLLGSLERRRVHPAVGHWAVIGSAFEAGRAAEFNRAAANYRRWLAAQGLGRELRKAAFEQLYNRARPFAKAIVVYLTGFVLASASWLGGSTLLYRSAAFLARLGLLVHTTGLMARMILEGRPPVTNLYSSAVFVGWGAVVLGLLMERSFRNGVGLGTATLVGAVTQIIAHNLAIGGDTMQMMQAVLDNNFWLATHVVVITLGYSAMLLAGLMAAGYVLTGVATPWLSVQAARSLERMVYGVYCFATLFSFTGTMLGGIWADQSWGRFWGWDPKENGALMIVLWAAIYLHARWGGLAGKPAQMALAAGGTIVTAFSWFGVNMLGVGLHSYGFMDSARSWLVGFVASQLLIMALGFLPRTLWWSFRTASASPSPTAAAALGQPERHAPRGTGRSSAPSLAGRGTCRGVDATAWSGPRGRRT